MKSFKVYNIFFPIWLIFLFPPIVFAVLIVNFIVDSLVLTVSLKKMGIENKKAIYKKTILKTWFFGFLSDMIGTIILLGVIFNEVVTEVEWLSDILNAIVFNPFSHPASFLLVSFAIVVAGVCIYYFNLMAFKKTELTEKQMKKIAFNLAIFTAPYFFLLPLSLFV